MLINYKTGEIAYHSLILKKDGGIKFKQYPLRSEEGKVKFITPKNWPYKTNKRINK